MNDENLKCNEEFLFTSTTLSSITRRVSMSQYLYTYFTTHSKVCTLSSQKEYIRLAHRVSMPGIVIECLFLSPHYNTKTAFSNPPRWERSHKAEFALDNNRNTTTSSLSMNGKQNVEGKDAFSNLLPWINLLTSTIHSSSPIIFKVFIQFPVSLNSNSLISYIFLIHIYCVLTVTVSISPFHVVCILMYM